MLLVTLAAQAAPFVDAVGLDLGNHSIAMPLGHLGRLAPLHPAGALTAEHAWARCGGFALAQQVRAGAMHQGLLGRSAWLGTDLLARFTTRPGPMAELGLGLGALHTWRTRAPLAWDNDAHTYVEAPDRGRPALAVGFSLGLGLDLGPWTGLPLTPSLQYRWFAQTPFLPGLSVGPQGIASVNLRWAMGGAR